jgi:hypothetical protein
VHPPGPLPTERFGRWQRHSRVHRLGLACVGVELRRGQQGCRGAGTGVSRLLRRLGKWSGYWRWLRCPGSDARIWIRRARCTPCRVNHALLPDFLLHRRLDEAAMIGQVLTLRVRHTVELRALARRFSLPRATLRGWWGPLSTISVRSLVGRCSRSAVAAFEVMDSDPGTMLATPASGQQTFGG